ncbi:hypothetical protein P168DRAFT_12677 [Aspergillus campestris IBT 28561]|uniref:Uncharacterized protein n=1 Tax=Aspergillus campestris (strain IBT 28561) TaxID=1392248 RepID=A0A2I1DEI3_ASPC2|nr:uncharacterized protein P168DRAFT_12677 [Aspergillus campestris IBT 28561]PKY08260.1 hypothetical protein P168DRAFT_12677 [Aspergillus campestris IBT 28561]
MVRYTTFVSGSWFGGAPSFFLSPSLFPPFLGRLEVGWLVGCVRRQRNSIGFWFLVPGFSFLCLFVGGTDPRGLLHFLHGVMIMHVRMRERKKEGKWLETDQLWYIIGGGMERVLRGLGLPHERNRNAKKCEM